ncbi:hypothetical protein [Novosphingobium sp. B 225]|uniref:hypothetical protein n=1 Tax=Novosphingobium sp. B 225 TaxID=1961849 RepID=UPI000B4B82CC|nr:hypothetical protein [Novosphingobium sp. B 225]
MRWLASSCTAYIASTVPAFAGSGINFQTIWMVGDPIASPDLPKANQVGAFQVSRGDIFMASRVLPQSAARLTDALRDDKGNVRVSQDAELFALKSDAAIFCTAQQDAGSKLIGFLAGGQTFGHVCLVDADRNGRFESAFDVIGQVKGLPSFAGAVPKSSKPPIDLGYMQLNPRDMRTVYFVGLQYLSNKNLFKNEIFEVVFGSTGNLGHLSERLMIKKKDIPGGLGLLGGDFSLLSSTEDGAQIRVNHPFARWTFNVERRVTYKFY